MNWIYRQFSRHPGVCLFVAALLAALAFQGTRGLYETTEGRYAECARQMLAAGNWLEPVLNGHFHWTKPPLTYWCIMVGLKLFGLNAWGARAVAGLAYALSVWAVFALARRVWGERDAPWCALVFAASPFVLGASNILSTDVFLLLGWALTCWCCWEALSSGRAGWVIATWAAFGFAFLAKGPPACLLLTGLIPTALLARRSSPMRFNWFHPLGVLSFVIIGLGWYLLMISRHEGLWRYWFVEEMVDRSLSDHFNRNPQWYKGVLIYFPVLLAGALPWVALLFWRDWRLPWPVAQCRFKPWRWANPLPWTFICCLFFVPLFVFMLSKSKLPLYVLPLFIPLSLAVGRGLSWKLEQHHFTPRLLWRWAALLLFGFPILKGIMGHLPEEKDMRQLSGTLAPVLAKYPDQTLYLVTTAPYLGLQFYLRQPLERYNPRDTPIPGVPDLDALPPVLGQRLRPGQGVLFLLHAHDEKRLRRLKFPYRIQLTEVATLPYGNSIMQLVRR